MAIAADGGGSIRIPAGLCGVVGLKPTYGRVSEHGQDVRVNLSIARALTALDYIHAQRVRSRLLGNFRRVFGEVDAIMTPTTATVAPPIPEALLRDGVSDLPTMAKLMRYATPANLAGFPAISFPAGYSSNGLPIGIQAIGRAWEESLLLRIARVGEKCLDRIPPKWHFQILQGSTRHHPG